MKRPALWQAGEADGTVRCELCPHRCRLGEGQTGRCGTRQMQDGQLYALHYGDVTAMALDPIEKKPLYHFMPGSRVLSVGSWGCNMRCPYCQNAAISQGPAPSRYWMPEALVQEAVRLQSKGNIGLAYTYNEPLTWYEFVLDCAQAIRAAGLKNVLVSNGNIQAAPLAALLPYLDAVNIDCKSFDEGFYRNTLGGDLSAVKRSVAQAVAAGVHTEVTMLVLAGHNDEVAPFTAMCDWLAALSPDIVLHLSRAFPRHHWHDLKITPRATLDTLQGIAQARLRHVYLGNVR